MNHRVQKFTKDGSFLGGWGSYGAGDGEFNMPWGVCVDELGDVYVADWRNDRIQKFSPDGEFLWTLGSSGDGELEFNRPARLTVDTDGDIYVADWGNDRVQQFDQTGRYVDTFIGDATLGKMAMTYIRSNAKVLRIRETTPLGQSKRLRSPSSVRIDDEGHLYITDHGCHRIQVYKKEAYPLTPEELLPPPNVPSLSTSSLLFPYWGTPQVCPPPPSWADRGRQNRIAATIQPHLPVIPSVARNLKSITARPDRQRRGCFLVNADPLSRSWERAGVRVNHPASP